MPLLAVAAVLPFVPPAAALVTGVAVALAFGNPWLPGTRKLAPLLLGIAVMGLGAAADLGVVGRVGAQGNRVHGRGHLPDVPRRASPRARLCRRGGHGAPRDGRDRDLRRQRDRGRGPRHQGEVGVHLRGARDGVSPQRRRARRVPAARASRRAGRSRDSACSRRSRSTTRARSWARRRPTGRRPWRWPRP